MSVGHHGSRGVIAAAYASGGYTMQDVGDSLGVHYSRVSWIVGAAEEAKRTAKDKTCPVEDRSHQEERFVALGMDAFGRTLVVVYIYRDPDTIRLISARQADASERKQYRL